MIYKLRVLGQKIPTIPTTILVFLWVFLVWCLVSSPGVVSSQTWSITLSLCGMSRTNCSFLLFTTCLEFKHVKHVKQEWHISKYLCLYNISYAFWAFLRHFNYIILTKRALITIISTCYQTTIVIKFFITMFSFIHKWCVYS